MVAFNSSRRQFSPPVAPPRADVQSLAHSAEPNELAGTAGSRRQSAAVEVSRDSAGEILGVRIGRWRRLTSEPQRRIAEVREFGGRRVAVRIERFIDGSQPSSEIWHLYDGEGRLDAALQSSPNQKFSLLTNYRTRQGARLALDAQGELVVVESWRL